MSNLKHIMMACQMYRLDNDKQWVFNNWCDTIEPYIGLKEGKYFQCPIDKTGPCSYAMNENIPADATDLPHDMVLLFESAPGWNQIGGPDDVVTDRGQPGANIAFINGDVKFVTPEDLPALRWTIDKSPKTVTPDLIRGPDGPQQE